MDELVQQEAYTKKCQEHLAALEKQLDKGLPPPPSLSFSSVHPPPRPRSPRLSQRRGLRRVASAWSPSCSSTASQTFIYFIFI
jgi:hypothetical protein